MVDDTVKVNVKHHARLGLKPVVKRVSSANCCDCVVEYFPGDGKKQNVWTKSGKMKMKVVK